MNQTCFLKKLALMDANLVKDSFFNLCNWIESSKTLIDLDVSFNRLNHQCFSHFFERIKDNKKI